MYAAARSKFVGRRTTEVVIARPKDLSQSRMVPCWLLQGWSLSCYRGGLENFITCHMEKPAHGPLADQQESGLNTYAGGYRGH